MELAERLPNHITKNTNCRKRRFKCTICDFQKTIYADGKNDEETFPNEGIEKANKNYKQEENNRL